MPDQQTVEAGAKPIPPPVPDWFCPVPAAPSWFHGTRSEPPFESERASPRRIDRLIPLALPIVRCCLAASLLLGVSGVLAYSFSAPVGGGDMPPPATPAPLMAIALGEEETVSIEENSPAEEQSPDGATDESVVTDIAVSPTMSVEAESCQSVTAAKLASSAVIVSPRSSDEPVERIVSPDVSESKGASVVPIPTVGKSVDLPESAAVVERGAFASAPLRPARRILLSGMADNVDSVSGTTDCPDGTCSKVRSLGTVVNWAETLDKACKLAKKQDKLVFLIQVSGDFAREEFT